VSVLAPPPPGHRRLDPRTLVTRVVTLSSLRQYWGALLPLLAVLGVNGGFRSGGLAAVLAAVIVVALVGALVEWLRTWYGVHDGRLVVERGVLRRSLTVVPVDRIRPWGTRMSRSTSSAKVCGAGVEVSRLVRSSASPAFHAAVTGSRFQKSGPSVASSAACRAKASVAGRCELTMADSWESNQSSAT